MTPPLQKDLKQAKTFSSLEAEVYLSLRLTAQQAREPWATFLKAKTGLSTTQYNLLRILQGAHPGGLTCGEVAERMINRDPDVTRLVDRLEKRQLVTRARDTADRRVVRVFIAKAGLATLKSLDKVAARFPKQILGHLGRKRLRELRALLDATRAGMGEVPQRPGGAGGREPEREVILRTQIRLKNGGTVLLGGPPIRSGVLVLALSARG